MALHHVEFSYKLPEWGSLEIEMDENLDLTEKEGIALAEIKEVFEEIEDIVIDSVKVI